jgi:tol-pal system protein YbgF
MKHFRQTGLLVMLTAVFVPAGEAAERGPAPVISAPAAEAGTAAGAGGQQQNASSIEARLLRVERVIESGTLVEMLQRLDSMQNEVQALRGQMDEQDHVIKGLREQQRNLYLDIDRRLSRLEQSGGTAPSAPPAGAPGAPAAVQQPAAAGVTMEPQAAQAGTQAAQQAGAMIDPTVERRAYEDAFAKIRNGEYEAATNALQDFLAKYPSGQYAGNAQYWLGEANYKNGLYAKAIQEFTKVGENYADSPKVPGSLLKIGFAYYELKDWARARAALEDLLKRYPQSSAARLGEARLHKMKIEGN